MKTFLFAALSATLSLSIPAFACDNCAQSETSAAKTVAAKLPVGIQTTTFSAPKIHCAGCAMGVKTALGKQAGVRSVEVDPKTKLVVVTYASKKQNPKMLAAALAKAGWPATEVKAKETKSVVSKPVASKTVVPKSDAVQ